MFKTSPSLIKILVTPLTPVVYVHLVFEVVHRVFFLLYKNDFKVFLKWRIFHLSCTHHIFLFSIVSLYWYREITYKYRGGVTFYHPLVLDQSPECFAKSRSVFSSCRMKRSLHHSNLPNWHVRVQNEIRWMIKFSWKVYSRVLCEKCNFNGTRKERIKRLSKTVMYSTYEKLDNIILHKIFILIYIRRTQTMIRISVR